MGSKAKYVSTLIFLVYNFISNVEGHGYVKSPRSRNWVAAADGVWSGGEDTLPEKENCPSCANTKNADGFCGIVDSRDYDNPKDAIGRPMIPQAQAVYTEGQIINMEFVFTANHNGHHLTYACPDFNNPTKECFEQHKLEFIEDLSMEVFGTDANAPKDPNYPERGYVNPGASHTFMRFKLPEGVTGDLVLLQWHWITGNSCRSSGYDDYPYPPGWEPSNMGPCPEGDDLSPIGVGAPEQFWNCMEVKITPGPSTPTPPSPPTPTPPTPTPPTPTPPTPTPPTPTPPTPTPPTPTPPTPTPPTPTPPTPPSPTPPTPTPPTPTPPSPPGNGCCSLNYSDCDASWCGSTESVCNNCNQNVVWLPNGPVSGCLAKWADCTNNINGCCSPAVCVGDQWYRQCIDGVNPPTPTPPTPTPPTPTPPTPTPPSPTPPSPTPPSPTPPTPTPPSSSGNGCCSLNYSDCDAGWCGSTESVCNNCNQHVTWLSNGPVSGCLAKWADCTNNINGCCSPAVCVGDQWYRQCVDGVNPPTPPTPPSPSPPSPTPPTPPTPTPPSPTPPSPTPPSPTPPVTPSPIPEGSNTLFSTVNTRSSFEALLQLDSITNIVQESNPPIYVIVASGGAAGSDTVISEGQGYAVMIAGITLAAMDLTDPNRQEVMFRFYGYFYGWKRMCQNSTPKAFCQSLKLCEGGIACLPGWKHNSDLTEVIGSGAAPDGDQDAIVGMIMAVKAVENDLQKPFWYDEVRKWADASATSFLFYNTKNSKTGNASRILKLGTCWGGWETEGNNPSYHSPGSYRLMKKYQNEFPSADRDYAMPNFDDGISDMETRWSRVIETSYNYINSAQCSDAGLVPNWAMVTETSPGDINLYPGSFSGSGTPQYEFGSEASRIMWRVLFDAAIFTNEAFEDAGNFLNPLHSKLAQGYNAGNWNDNTLTTCTGVTSIFPSWRFNAFIYSPVYSTLVLKIEGIDEATQQTMIDAAGEYVDNISSSMTYYPRCWAIIGIITMNGDVAKAAVNIGLSPNFNSTTSPPTPTSPTPPSNNTPTSPTPPSNNNPLPPTPTSPTPPSNNTPTSPTPPSNNNPLPPTPTSPTPPSNNTPTSPTPPSNNNPLPPTPTSPTPPSNNTTSTTTPTTATASPSRSSSPTFSPDLISLLQPLLDILSALLEELMNILSALLGP